MDVPAQLTLTIASFLLDRTLTGLNGTLSLQCKLNLIWSSTGFLSVAITFHRLNLRRVVPGRHKNQLISQRHCMFYNNNTEAIAQHPRSKPKSLHGSPKIKKRSEFSHNEIRPFWRPIFQRFHQHLNSKSTNSLVSQSKISRHTPELQTEIQPSHKNITCSKSLVQSKYLCTLSST